MTSRTFNSGFIFAVMISNIAMALSNPSEGIKLFVAPNGKGSDCSYKNPCALEDAKSKVSVLNTNAGRDVTIELSGGTYSLSKPLTFGAGDSGRNFHKVRYVGAKSAQVIISGSVPIINWSLFNPSLGIWSAPLPESVTPNEVTGTISRSFYFDNERGDRARINVTPVVAGPPKLGAAKLSIDHGYFLKLSGMENWRNPKDIEIVYTNAWSMIRCPVDAVSAGKISVQFECWNAMEKNYTHKYGVGLNWLENNLSFLTEPGQWYIDKQRKRLYYMPRPGQDMTKGHAELALSEQLMILNGASYLSFEGITFTKTNWYGYRGSDPDHRYVGYTPHQSGDNADLKQQPLAAVDVSMSNHVVFQGDKFLNLGGSAMTLRAGSSNISIIGGQFNSIAAAGLQIGTPSEFREVKQERQNSDILITNVHFSNVGMEYWDNPAIMAYALRDSKIEHNEIDNCPWSCLAFGWGWGGFAAYSRNVLMANNYIHDGMQRLYDGGGLYTNGKTNGGIMIENNVIEQIGTMAEPLCQNDWWKKNFHGIYHDAGSDDYVDRNNLVINVVPRNLVSERTDQCRGNWLRLDPEIHVSVAGNAVDYDHVFISPQLRVSEKCKAGDSTTRCILGESDNLISPDINSSKRAKSIRAHAGPLL